MTKDMIIPWKDVQPGDEVLMGGTMREIVSVSQLMGKPAGIEIRYITAGGSSLVWQYEDFLTAVRREEKKMTKVANDEDTLTVGELREAIRRKARTQDSPVLMIDGHSVHEIMEDIQAHREHLENGAVYRDAAGTYLKWDGKEYAFRTFGAIGVVLKDTPPRPLVKIS